MTADDPDAVATDEAADDADDAGDGPVDGAPTGSRAGEALAGDQTAAPGTDPAVAAEPAEPGPGSAPEPIVAAPTPSPPTDEQVPTAPPAAGRPAPTDDRSAETPAAPAARAASATGPNEVATPATGPEQLGRPPSGRRESPEEPPDTSTAATTPAPASEGLAEPRRLGPARFRLERRVRLVFALAVVLALVLAAAGTIAFRQVLDARDELIDRADPGLQASSGLLAALVDQETGVRAYVLSADDTFLDPYEQGAEAADDARAELDRVTADLPAVGTQLEEVDRGIAAWREDYAEPTIDEVQAGEDSPGEEASLREGRALFEDVRTQVADLQDLLTRARADARDRLDATTVRLLLILAITALAVAMIAAFVHRLMRRSVEAPLQQLSRDAQQIAGGELDHPVEAVGPVELQELAVAMDRMRQRIVDELEAVTQARDALERQTGDLARSNAELEQFAYVASHDLQEPLRKVSSFCQLLQSRYGGQLDDRADQYIAFAVDGAKRMQALINDLLALSRVGRTPADAVVVRAGQLIDVALENLSDEIEATDAKITVVGPLPRVRVETSLGVALFQNLVSNALKFRQPDVAPSVHVSARRSAGFHEFTVSDEGIGIAPEYADRIFVIFQRLHGRDGFGGTGIGLALCRKIVEGHGGRIWVDTGGHADGQAHEVTGTTIRFTLPVVEGDA